MPGAFRYRPETNAAQGNSIVHVTEHEGDPSRRPLTYDEIQALFDAADARVEQIRAHHRNGATAAMGTPLFSNRCTRSGFAAAKPGDWSP